MRLNVAIYINFYSFFHEVKEKQKTNDENCKSKEQTKEQKNIKNNKTLRKRLRNEVYLINI